MGYPLCMGFDRNASCQVADKISGADGPIEAP